MPTRPPRMARGSDEGQPWRRPVGTSSSRLRAGTACLPRSAPTSLASWRRATLANQGRFTTKFVSEGLHNLREAERISRRRLLGGDPRRGQHRRRHGSRADNGRLRHRQLVCQDHGSSGSRRPRSRLLVWWRVAGRSARDGVSPVRSRRLGGALVAVHGHAPGLAWRRGAGRRR